MFEEISAIEAIVVIAIIGILISVGFSVAYEIQHPCIQSHKEMVHHEAWNQYVMVGKTWTWIPHPAYDAEEEVCDKRK